MIKAILFDFDGTVMDTTNVIIQSWQHTYLTIDGKEKDPEAIKKTFGEVLEDSMKREFPNTPYEECLNIYRSYQKNIFAGAITTFPGMKEVIEKLHERGIKMAMVTSRTRRSLIAGLDANGMLEYFPVLVTCDDTDAHKPSPVPAQIAMDELGVKPEECLLIGDSKYDIGCAHNAGVKAVLVSWTVSLSEEDIKEAAPEYIVTDAEQILELC